MESLRCLAVVPVYEYMEGNVCVYYGLRGEAERRGFTVQTQMRRFFREHGMDDRAYRAKAREILGIRRQLPLAYASDCIFLPVKVRVPVAKGDGAYAYVRCEGIRRVEDSRILLTTGEPLACLQSRRSLLEAISRACVMRAVLRSEEARTHAERELMRLRIGRVPAVSDDTTMYG